MDNRNCRKFFCFGLCLVLLFNIAGCRQYDFDKKIKVTMLYPIELKQFEQIVEKIYPDIDLRVESTTSAEING